MSKRQITWLSETGSPAAFPPVSEALLEPDGLLAAGGDLSTTRLLAAYRQGIFPWYDDGQPLLWWSPDPRCVFLPGDLHVSRSLRRTIRSEPWQVRFNTAFGDVIRACAGKRRGQPGTWITSDMLAAYERLHTEGWAHSIEIWLEDRLVGGLYGLAIGRVLFGESMYSRRSNASKIALLFIDRLLASGTFGLLDCQVRSPHLLTMGASVIPRTRFVGYLADLCTPPDPFTGWPAAPIGAVDLIEA